jgi:uncharacterized cupredoxin-like copper-binding protein
VSLKSLLLGCLGLLFIATLAGCGGGGTEEGKEEAATVQEEEAPVGGSTTADATPPVSTEEATPVAEGPIDTIRVNETEMSLDPSDITLERPGTYVFRAVNVGEVVHSLRIEGNGIEEQQTGEIGPGESADLPVALEPGTYELDCPVGNHEELGMRGRVTVQEG